MYKAKQAAIDEIIMYAKFKLLYEILRSESESIIAMFIKGPKH